MTTLEPSKLVKDQKKQFTIETPSSVIVAHVRYDDECGNGHNSFSITADIYSPERQRGEPTVKHSNGRTMWLNQCGCCHEAVSEHFPQLAPFLKWHLFDSTGPMHYLANGLYWAGHKGFVDGKPGSPPNLDYLKSTIVYGALHQDKDFDLESCLFRFGAPGQYNNTATADLLGAWLVSRRDDLIEAFRRDVESLGFVF